MNYKYIYKSDKYKLRYVTKKEQKELVYIERDEKGIPIHNDEPYQILEYKGLSIPIYSDDYGQQDFIVLGNEVFGGGAYNFGAIYDFMYLIDKWLENGGNKSEN